jgi:nanoRNase/pAp phosphatase (c-di-AMP/oligoRNAs hydrolase)
MNPMTLTPRNPAAGGPRDRSAADRSALEAGRLRVEQLRAVLTGRKRLLVLTHKNPDPDSLGGAMGLREFARQVAGVDSDFAVTGRILRAENQTMVRELGIAMRQLDEVDLSAYDCVALVDTQPGFSHTIVPPELRPDIVIDHHACEADPDRVKGVAFVDVRIDVGATSSLVASYLMLAGVVPTREVATGLTYGIKTDTADLSRGVTDLDLAAHSYLFPHVDRQALARIASPRLPLAYFQKLKNALGELRLYDGVALCSLGASVNPEMIAEVADLLMRMEGVRAVFCGGVTGSDYYISVRTDVGGDAWQLIRAAMDGEKGSCGGHGPVAGGAVPLDDKNSRTWHRLERRLERNILRTMGLAGANAVVLDRRED